MISLVRPKLSRLAIGGLILGLGVLASGCAFTPVAPPRGLIYNDQISVLFPGRGPGLKEGRASSQNVLFLVGWGNSGLKAAMEDGGITELKHTDYRMQNYLLIYQRYTTIAYGD